MGPGRLVLAIARWRAEGCLAADLAFARGCPCACVSAFARLCVHTRVCTHACADVVARAPVERAALQPRRGGGRPARLMSGQKAANLAVKSLQRDHGYTENGWTE